VKMSDITKTLREIAQVEEDAYALRTGRSPGVEGRLAWRAADEIESLTTERDFWKSRSDQRQIDINELKQNPASTIPDT